MLYKDIEISRIFEEPLDDTLGEPLNSYGASYAYDGITVYYTGSVSSIYSGTLNLFTIDGITFDKSQEDVVAAFGEPVAANYQGEGRFLSYHTSSGYSVIFWFTASFNTPYSITIAPIERPKPPEVTGELLSAAEAQAFLIERIDGFGEISYLPNANRYEEEILFYGFSLDYSDCVPNSSGSTVAHAWVNSLTGESSFEERELYANVPDDMFPIPTRNGKVVPYDYFTTPGHAWGGGYSFSDISVMDIYQSQLRDAGFSDHGNVMAITSLWTYERASDGKILYVELRANTESFSIVMIVTNISD